jgi:uncharacterized membrane protein
MIKFIGIALIVLGLCSVAWGGFTYKTRKKVLEIGSIEATREETHYIPVAPVAGGLIVAAGIGLLISRKV